MNLIYHPFPAGSWGHIAETTSGQGLLAAEISVVTGLGCWIASNVCQLSAKRAKNSGNISKYKKLKNVVNGLNTATGIFLGAGTIGSAISIRSLVEFED